MISRHPLRTVAIALLGILVVAAAGVAVVGRADLEPLQHNHHQQVVVTVSAHEQLTSLAATLGEDHLVRSPFFFVLYAAVRGLGTKLHPGKFLLDRGMGASEMVAVLEGPVPDLTKAPAIRVTVPDGLSAQQEASLLQQYGLFSPASYLAQIQSGNYPTINHLPGSPALSSWEGMAFGDTYLVSPAISARQFLMLQLQDFDRKARPSLLAGASRVGLTPYQVVVMASVVEAEAASAHDRRLVAGVFFNRLRLGMPLQSDVTVLYAMALAGQGNAKFSTMFPSPYNTYLHAGLPPGPIDSPGIGALEAVLHPTASSYLYFVSLPNGKLLYAVTAAQHQQQVQEAGLG